MSIDTTGETWSTIALVVSDELESGRLALESSLSPTATEYQRGRVAALRWLLALPERQRQDRQREVSPLL